MFGAICTITNRKKVMRTVSKLQMMSKIRWTVSRKIVMSHFKWWAINTQTWKPAAADDPACLQHSELFLHIFAARNQVLFETEIHHSRSRSKPCKEASSDKNKNILYVRCSVPRISHHVSITLFPTLIAMFAASEGTFKTNFINLYWVHGIVPMNTLNMY